MKIVFLGTNGWYDSLTGHTSCVLVEEKNRYLIFDAGSGFYKVDLFIKERKPIFLFLSHFHIDHIVGLHILAKFNFKQGIDIFGPTGLKDLFTQVINKPYSLAINKIKTKIRLHELDVKNIFYYDFEYRLLKHSVFCYGYKVFIENRTVAYCTDTGFCTNLFRLVQNADVFISECAYRKGESSRKWPHLNPEMAAQIAKKASAKRMFLMHFDASRYKTLKDRREAAIIAKRIFRYTEVCHDDLTVII